MHVAKIERKHGGKTYVSYLLRRSYRAEGKVKHHTLANLSHLPEQVIDLIRRSLQGETFITPAQAFRTLQSKPHGHVEAILTACRRLEMEDLLGSQPCRQRSVILALLVQRLLSPCSKLACTRLWHSTTLAEELDVAEATTKEVYAALDWLLKRQPYIEQKLARRHLQEGGVVLYDVSSSYYEGQSCPLAEYGHNRDGKKGLPIIVYGLLTDRDGRPVAVQVYAGNTADSTTVVGQVKRLRQRFALKRVVLVGDRGMLTQTQIDTLRKYPGLGWLSALRSEDIQKLVRKELVDREDLKKALLAEISSPDFPDERLVVCYNATLAEKRRNKRQELLRATEENLTRLVKEVQRRTSKPLNAAQIGIKLGKIISQHKMAKHFTIKISDGVLQWSRDAGAVAREEELDGIYVIRTGEAASVFSAEECVRTYKRLTQVETVFRCLKSMDILVRPIHHRLPNRVRAHVLLCALAYYVEWWLRRAWRPLLYEDEQKEQQRQERHPVPAAKASESCQEKKKTHKSEKGFPTHSFSTLLAHLGTRCRSTHQLPPEAGGLTFQQVTEMDPLQTEAFRLLNL
jgi:transposase